jgi:hypothetical protein
MRAHGGDEPRARTFRRWITCVLILSLTGAPPAIPQHTGPRHIDLVPTGATRLQQLQAQVADLGQQAVQSRLAGDRPCDGGPAGG